MHLTPWLLIPFVASPATGIGLIYMLRRLLRPSTRGTDATWAYIDARWSLWTTRILPTLITPVLLTLFAWPFAYLGWELMALAGDVSASQAFPPWFGNPGYFLVFAFLGILTLLGSLLIVASVVAAFYLIGRWTIWPQAN